ncbi:MAG: hydrolase [Chloroflexi bacterium]|nr:MAG: hydrolase [Chloroflexota bacterium]
MARLERHEGVRIRATEVDLEADLGLPAGATGVVILGTSATASEPAGEPIVETLEEAGLGVLQLSLLSDRELHEEGVTGELGMNFELIARRILAARNWLRESGVPGLPAGYLASGTAVSAALVAASQEPEDVQAVVARDGLPELSRDRLGSVTAPTLLLVSSDDPLVKLLNESAFDELPGEKELRLVPARPVGSGEPGTADEVAALTRDWFLRFLAPVE